MIYILDTADIDAIKHCNEFYPLAGVTTNPSIISKENTDFWKLVKKIRSIIGEEKMLHVQTVQTKADKIVEEAKLLKKELGGELFVKIPIGEEGLKATMELKKLGIGVTINRLDNIIGDGTEVVAQIVELFDNYNLDCKVLAASFKNAEQVHKCALYGCHSVTVSADIMKTLISHPMTDAAIVGFEKDWKRVYGNKTILDF